MMRFTSEEMSVLSSFITDLAFAHRKDLLMKVMEAITVVDHWRHDNPALTEDDEHIDT